MICGLDSGIIINTVVNIHNFIAATNPNRIYLDIDGVIWHSCQAVCDIINKKYDTNVKGNEILSWNFKELKSDLSDSDVESIFADPFFFAYVKWIKGAFEFIRIYEENITIVTKGTFRNLRFKLDTFENLGLNVPICCLPLDSSKNMINMEGGLLIDDCTKNLKESNATHKIQFLEYDDNKNDIREWTKDWKGLKMYRWNYEKKSQ